LTEVTFGGSGILEIANLSYYSVTIPLPNSLHFTFSPTIRSSLPKNP